MAHTASTTMTTSRRGEKSTGTNLHAAVSPFAGVPVVSGTSIVEDARYTDRLTSRSAVGGPVPGMGTNVLGPVKTSAESTFPVLRLSSPASTGVGTSRRTSLIPTLNLVLVVSSALSSAIAGEGTKD